jgi:thiol-disulfide isomerase/thioredoxin
MKPLLVSAFVCLAALNIFADPFSDLSFDAASKQAAQSGKVVLVDFYTTWCGPCKMLDKNTWTDADVIKLLEQKTVALRIDAEKETKLAERYKIEAYPSVLLIKPDGTELDRLVGYRDPKTFIADFTATLSGKDSLARAQEKLTAAGTNDPMARMSYAKVLAQKGRDAEALEEYLWCFDHGNEASPAFVGVRVSFLLADIKGLAGHYPAARKALESRRDERQAKLQAGSSDYSIATDLVELNSALDQKEKNLAVFDRLPAGSFARDAVPK